jgi:hypothetical protein
MEFAHDDVKYISTLLPNVRANKEVSSFFLNLVTMSRESLQELQNLNYVVKESRALAISEPIPKGDNYELIPEKIRKSRFMEFAPHKHIHRESVKIKHRTYNFVVVQFTKVPINPSLLVKQACAWLLIASHFAPLFCSKTVDVNLYLTEAKKVLPTKVQEYVDESHANTAFTTSCAKHTTINLFRFEEWFKVFIHETFHNLGLDFSNYLKLCKTANAEILQAFRINSEVRLYETYCEMWAEIMNVVIRNVANHIKMSPENVVKKVEHDLRMERAFSLFQTIKLLRHFKMKYSDFVNGDVTVKEKYKERTEVFSYFILKSVLMFNYSKFIEWCMRNNGGSLHFQNPETNILKYARELILAQYSQPLFLRAIEVVEDAEFSHKKRVHNVHFLHSTMRMSVFG